MGGDGFEGRQSGEGEKLNGADANCRTINKNSETDIGVQPEDQKSKAASHWLLPQPQSKNGDPAFRNFRMRLCLRAVSSCFIVLSRAEIKGVHHWD